jgi:hypothetical protein
MKRDITKVNGLLTGLGVLGTVMLFISACDEYFEVQPVSSFEPGNVFTNVEYTKQTIMGIYQLMTRDEGYSKRISMYYGVDTDIGMCSGSDLDNGRRDIARYTCSPGNDEIEKPWNNLYKGIERANICIANIPVSDLYINGTEEEQFEMKRCYGEALALRALNYYELIRNWGDVPFTLTPAQAGDDFNLPKTDRDTIYEQIINDLLLAETLVPWRSEVATDERITKGAVKGLLARIALARGGYSLRRTGGMQRGSDYLHYYQIARDQCREIILSGEHSLNPDYEDIFRKQCEMAVDDEYGESMWEVALGLGVSGEVGYYIGSKSDDGSRYGRGNPGLLALPTYYLSFDSLDKRRDVTIAIYEIDGDNIRLLRSFSDINLAKWRREWMVPIYPGTAKYTGINWVLLRYSDVLLMFAEAENELNGGPTQEAIDAFRQVRTRAFSPDADKMPSIPTDYQGFFNALVQERAWEFGGECIRKFDLIRWNMLGTRLAETKDNLNKLYNGEPPYENVPRVLVWRNEGEELQILNLTTPMDSAAIADRDMEYWTDTKDWADNILEEYVDLLAKYFVANSRELLPIHNKIIDANSRLQNDYGY